MKYLIFWIGFTLFIIACATQKNTMKVKSVAVENISEDSLEYDLETFDARFESWYKLHNNPALYRSQSYYESWNKQYVTAWNMNSRDIRKSWFFEPIIGYEPSVDYGFEINHELFYYFQYVEKVLKIGIMPNSPQSVIF